MHTTSKTSSLVYPNPSYFYRQCYYSRLHPAGLSRVERCHLPHLSNSIKKQRKDRNNDIALQYYFLLIEEDALNPYYLYSDHSAGEKHRCSYYGLVQSHHAIRESCISLHDSSSHYYCSEQLFVRSSVLLFASS